MCIFDSRQQIRHLKEGFRQKESTNTKWIHTVDTRAVTDIVVESRRATVVQSQEQKI